MINEEKRQALLSGLKTGPSRAIEVLATLQRDELVTLKEALDQLFPTRSLGEINLEHELIAQFITVKELQQAVMTDKEVPANQRAQVANSVAATLQQLIKMQSEFHTAERFKAIEAMMIKAIRKLPVEVAEQFLSEYERMEG